MSRGKRSQSRYRILSFLAVTLTAVTAAMVISQLTITPKGLVTALIPNSFPDVQVSGQMRTVIPNIRSPRMVLALLSGAGLAVAGAAFQELFANPLATPGTLGAANGASFGAVLGTLLGLPASDTQTLATITGVAAVFMAWNMARVRGTVPSLMAVLTGMVVSSLLPTLVSLVKYAADPQDVLPSIIYWLVGSMTSTTRTTLIMRAPFILVGSPFLFPLKWKLNTMSFPKDEAESLSIPVKRIHDLMILGAAMVTTIVTSMCGQIGWMGPLIPYMVRMIFRGDNRSMVPVSMASGALSMPTIDTAVRSVVTTEVLISILTSLIGAPCFILFLRGTGDIHLRYLR